MVGFLEQTITGLIERPQHPLFGKMHHVAARSKVFAIVAEISRRGNILKNCPAAEHRRYDRLPRLPGPDA